MVECDAAIFAWFSVHSDYPPRSDGFLPLAGCDYDYGYCKNGTTTDIKSQVCSILANG